MFPRQIKDLNHALIKQLDTRSTGIHAYDMMFASFVD
jgi:hypothetical protein